MATQPATAPAVAPAPTPNVPPAPFTVPDRPELIVSPAYLKYVEKMRKLGY